MLFDPLRSLMRIRRSGLLAYAAALLLTAALVGVLYWPAPPPAAESAKAPSCVPATRAPPMLVAGGLAASAVVEREDCPAAVGVACRAWDVDFGAYVMRLPQFNDADAAAGFFAHGRGQLAQMGELCAMPTPRRSTIASSRADTIALCARPADPSNATHILASAHAFTRGSLLVTEPAMVRSPPVCPRWYEDIPDDVLRDRVVPAGPLPHAPSSTSAPTEASARKDPTELGVFMIGEEGSSFQHFMDSLLPKIATYFPVVQAACGNVITHDEFRGLAGSIARDVLGLRDAGVADAATVPRRWAFLCDVPLRHPLPYRRARDLLGVTARAQNSTQRPVVLLYDRVGGNRQLINRDDVVQAVTAAAVARGLEFLVLGRDVHAEQHADALALFARVRYAFGVHGGAFENFLYLAEGARVVEIYPMCRYTSSIALASFWTNHVLIHVDYVLFASDCTLGESVTVDPTQLVNILFQST